MQKNIANLSVWFVFVSIIHVIQKLKLDFSQWLSSYKLTYWFHNVEGLSDNNSKHYIGKMFFLPMESGLNYTVFACVNLFSQWLLPQN